MTEFLWSDVMAPKLLNMNKSYGIDKETNFLEGEETFYHEFNNLITLSKKHKIAFKYYTD